MVVAPHLLQLLYLTVTTATITTIKIRTLLLQYHLLQRLGKVDLASKFHLYPPTPASATVLPPAPAPVQLKRHEAQPPCHFGRFPWKANSHSHMVPARAPVPAPHTTPSPHQQVHTPTPIPHEITASSPLPNVVYAHVHPPPRSNSVAEPPDRFMSASPLPSSSSEGSLSSKFWAFPLFLLVLLPQSSRTRGNYSFVTKLASTFLKTSSTSFHPGKETNLSLQREREREREREQCQKGISLACMNVYYCCILVNIQCGDAFLGQSHRGDRPVMTFIDTVMYHPSCINTRREKHNQEMYNKPFCS